MRLFISKKQLSLSAYIVAFKAILDWSYVAYVSARHSHEGFGLSLNIVKYSESWMLLLLALGFISKELKRPSDFYVIIVLLGVLVPVYSLYGLEDKERLVVYALTVSLLITIFFRDVPLIKLPLIKGSKITAILVAVGLSILVTIWFFLSGAFANFNLDLTKVYQFRRETGELIHVGFMGYVNNWAIKVCGLFLLSLALLEKRFFVSILVIAIYVFWFGVIAHKSTLFFPVLIVFVWFYWKDNKSLNILPFSLCAIVALSVAISIFANYGFVASLFVRRAFFVIANNTFDYYEFFGNNQFVYWSNSLSSAVLDYPYKLSPPKLIGVWQGNEAHINNSYLSTGYMHAGSAGIFLYSVLVGVLFKIIDKLVSSATPVWFVIAVTIVPMRALITSADLPTAMLTHGIALSLLLIFLVRKSSKV